MSPTGAPPPRRPGRQDEQRERGDARLRLVPPPAPTRRVPQARRPASSTPTSAATAGAPSRAKSAAPRTTIGVPRTSTSTGAQGAPRTQSAQSAQSTQRTQRTTSRTTSRPVPRPARRPAPRPQQRTPSQRTTSRWAPRAGSPQRRSAAVVVVLALLAAVFSGRLVQLQVTDAGPLAQEALGQRMAEDRLPATRGAITDRDGQVFAQNVERRDIVADPKLFTGPTPREEELRTPQDAAAQLAPVLGVPEADLVAALTPRNDASGKPVRWTVLAHGVTPAVRRQVQALQIPGLRSERKELRTYPAGTTAGNLVGYVSTDGTALAGIELAQDDVLRGTDGRHVYERGKGGQEIPLADSLDVPAVDGRDVRLTLDADLQFYAQRAAVSQAAATRAAWVSVVVMTKDGQVLALAESGSIDPARPGATPEAERHNRSLEDTFEPGSTGKVITAAAAIEEGLATPETQLVVPDRIALPRRGGDVEDSHDHAPQKLTFAGVLAESSNVGTIMVGQQLTLQQRYDYLRAFGLGSKQLGLPGETRGLLGTPEDWTADGSRTPYVVLFGQGYGVNALQAAQVYATIANDGVRVPPRVVAGTTDASGAFAPAPVPTGTRVVSETTAAQVTSMLEGVVSSEGTGMNAAVPGFRVAGKTGTAEDIQATRATGTKQYTASFIGMAPAEDPQLVVAVIVQHPDLAHHYGGVAAAPVFSDVMGFALAQQGIAPSGQPPALVPLTWR